MNQDRAISINLHSAENSKLSYIMNPESVMVFQVGKKKREREGLIVGLN